MSWIAGNFLLPSHIEISLTSTTLRYHASGIIIFNIQNGQQLQMFIKGNDAQLTVIEN